MVPRPSSILLLASTATLVGCADEVTEIYYRYPEAVFSQSSVDFGGAEQGASVVREVTLTNMGDLPMGVKSITLGANDYSSEFTVSWTRTEITCPESAPTDTGASARRIGLDSGTGETGIEDTAGGPVEEVELVLEPQCSIPLHLSYTANRLGTVWGSIILETVEEELDDNAPASAEPGYYADPTNTKRMVYLRGEGEKGIPNVLVSPRRYDFGNLWSGLTDKAFITVRNLGDGTLIVSNIYLSSSDCDSSFTISNAKEGFDTTLEPGEATFVEITFAPIDVDAAYCDLYIESNDEDSPAISVPLQGNAGLDPNNVAPYVSIRSPVNGYQHAGHDPFEIELNIFDANQPATSLACSIRSMVLLEGATIGDCVASDSSGHVYVYVDPDDLGRGNDTIRIQVTDGEEVVSYDSIAVLLNAMYPDSDDDGDGWGDIGDIDEFGNYDCDDHEINTYPYAAEISDRKDNDCDKVVDEGTSLYDDDSDKYTEQGGDCNDLDSEIYPGAEEQTDSKDNDCDGTIDEGTSVYDDDGDGFTEMDMDCDDEEPEINPGAVEYCDGVDNNCNGLRDYADGCIELSSVPYIVGGINMQQTACESGDRISLSVFVYDADGQSITYAWTADSGVTIEPMTGSPTVTVTCPTVSDQSRGDVYSLYVVANDEDGNAVWDFADLTVFPKDDLYTPLIKTIIEEGCSTTGTTGARGLSIAGLALLAAALRRRQRR